MFVNVLGKSGVRLWSGMVGDEQILQAALRVIAEAGYAGATTKEIAKAAGVSEVTLFRRFGSKKELLLTAVQRDSQHFWDAGIGYTGDVAADLGRIVTFYQQLMDTRGPTVIVIIIELARQPDLREVMSIPQQLMSHSTAVLQQYQEQGILIPQPPQQALASLLGPLMLDGILRTIYPAGASPPFAPDTLVENYLQGYRQG
jgi:AcrR family transcriptional regulator